MSWFIFFWKTIKSGWTVLAIIISILGNFGTILSWFVSSNNSLAQWVSDNWPKLSWQTWIIVALVIIVISSIARAFKMYKIEVVNIISLKQQFESDRLKFKHEFEQSIRKLWEISKIDSNEPLNLQICERTRNSHWTDIITPNLEIISKMPKLKKWLSWHSPTIDGILEIKNNSSVPIRVRATGEIIDGNIPLNNKNITYIIQWQGIPDEEKIIWPNDSAVLYVVCFTVRTANKWTLPKQVLMFPTAEREKERFKVNFIIQHLESIAEYMSNKQWKPKTVQIRVVLNAASLLNPTKGTSSTIDFKIQPDEYSENLLFERVTKVTDITTMK